MINTQHIDDLGHWLLTATRDERVARYEWQRNGGALLIPDGPAYWVVPISRPGVLCAPDAIARGISAGLPGASEEER